MLGGERYTESYQEESSKAENVLVLLTLAIAIAGESPTCCILHEGIHTPYTTRAIEVSHAACRAELSFDQNHFLVDLTAEAHFFQFVEQLPTHAEGCSRVVPQLRI